jgi:ATP-dependent DNA ligase
VNLAREIWVEDHALDQSADRGCRTSQSNKSSRNCRRIGPRASRVGAKAPRSGVHRAHGRAAGESATRGDEWAYEPKWDGYRALIIKVSANVQLRSRNYKDLMRMYPAVAAAGSRVNAGTAVIDGELVAMAPEASKPSSSPARTDVIGRRSTHPTHCT